MPTGNVTASVGLRWWVRPYLTTLVLVAIVMDAEPDWEKVACLIGRRGVWVRWAWT